MLTSRREIPEVSIKPPARMKSGMARRGKLEAPEKRFSGTTLSDALPLKNRKIIAAMERPKPMGTSMSVSKITTARMSHSMPNLLSSRFHPCRDAHESHQADHEHQAAGDRQDAIDPAHLYPN